MRNIPSGGGKNENVWNDGTGEERKSEIFSPSGGGENFSPNPRSMPIPQKPFPKEITSL
jgi:hypothetical protein